MDIQIKNKIVAEMEAYLTLHGMSAAQFSEISQVSESYISNIRKGDFTYNAGKGKTIEIAEKYFKKIADAIALKLEKSYWNTIPTSQLKRIFATFEDAQNYGYTNVIIGETGCGKTYAAHLFAQANPKNFFLITVSQSDNLGDLLDKIIDKFRTSEVPRSKSAKLRFIMNKMRELKLEGANPVLAFDEAEYMKQPALCAMKELYDNLNGICAIQLIGTDQLVRKIEQLKKRNKDGIPQLYRRIKFGIRQLPNIDRSFKQFLNGLETSLQKFVQEYCDNYGELHDVLVPAMREADRLGEPLTKNLVSKILGLKD